MKTIDWVRVALLIIGIVCLMKGIDRLRYPKYELVFSKNNSSEPGSVPERPRVKKSVSATVFAVLQVSIGTVLVAGIGWTIWFWDRWRLGSIRGTKGGTG